jgi:hypothetical protein
MYVLMLTSVHFLNAEIDGHLASFDLNHDGGFSGAEITPAMEAAMDDFQNDTVRAMAPVVGPVFCPLYVGVVFGAWALLSRLRARIMR